MINFRHGILPVYSHESLEVTRKMLEASYLAGLRIFEFTNRHPDALTIFRSLHKLCRDEMTDMVLGAGTIRNEEEARQFSAEGAAFLVSPCISDELINYSSLHPIPWLPGCATPSEIGRARSAGIHMIKLFPIRYLGGVDFLKAMYGPFPDLDFVVTGGIRDDAIEIGNYLKAGARAVGLGNSFFQETASRDEVTLKIANLIASLNDGRDAS